MAKPHRQRPLPSTPVAAPAGTTDPDGQPGTEGRTGAGGPGGAHAPATTRPAATKVPREGRTVPAPAQRVEPEYLIRGTGCRAGHERGHELDADGLGRLPSRKLTRRGFGLVLWCTVGLALVVGASWIGIVIQLLVLWLVFSAVLQRRGGHRGRCWRTRAWRRAWGGLVPSFGSDPTRPAGT